MGELERGKARVLCVKIKIFVWSLLFGAKYFKKEEGRRKKQGKRVKRDLKVRTKP